MSVLSEMKGVAKALAAACLTALVVPAAATAAFPGADGLIALTGPAPAAGGEALYGYDPVSRERTQLTSPNGLVDTDPAWSPSGTQLAFTRIISGSESKLMITNASGAEPRPLFPVETGLIESEPTFSPDGTQIVFRGRPQGSSFLSGDDELYSVALDGSGLTPLTNTPGLVVQEPAWSPTGDRIAYSRAAAGGNQLGPSDIYLLYLGTGESTLVTRRRPNADDDDANWRPDGKRLVYERERSKGPDDLATIRPNGNNSRLMLRAADGTELRDPGYSPSGEKIAVHRTTPSKAGIAIYDIRRKRISRSLIPASQNESDWQPIDD